MNNTILVYKNWTDFKTEVSNRSMYPQWYAHKKGNPNNDQYRIYALDELFLFQTIIEQDGGVDVTDFENNYKDSWNQQLEHRNSSGIKRHTTSPKPNNTITYFAGAGDNGGISNGNKLLFDVTDQDASKMVEVSFNEDIYIKDGIVQFENAPFGSYIDVEIVHPVDGVIASYCKKVFMLGTGILNINSQDNAKIANGLKIRCTVYNATTQTNFKVVGTLEIYRTTTV